MVLQQHTFARVSSVPVAPLCLPIATLVLELSRKMRVTHCRQPKLLDTYVQVLLQDDSPQRLHSFQLAACSLVLPDGLVANVFSLAALSQQSRTSITGRISVQCSASPRGAVKCLCLCLPLHGARFGSWCAYRRWKACSTSAAGDKRCCREASLCSEAF